MPPQKTIWEEEAPPLVQRMIARGLMSVIPQKHVLSAYEIKAAKLGLTMDEYQARDLKRKKARLFQKQRANRERTNTNNQNGH